MDIILVPTPTSLTTQVNIPELSESYIRRVSAMDPSVRAYNDYYISRATTSMTATKTSG